MLFGDVSCRQKVPFCTSWHMWDGQVKSALRLRRNIKSPTLSTWAPSSHLVWNDNKGSVVKRQPIRPSYNEVAQVSLFHVGHHGAIYYYGRILIGWCYFCVNRSLCLPQDPHIIMTFERIWVGSRQWPPRLYEDGVTGIPISSPLRSSPLSSPPMAFYYNHDSRQRWTALLMFKSHALCMEIYQNTREGIVCSL